MCCPATPQLVVNTFQGATATPGKLLAMSDAYRVGTRRQFRWLVIPSMMEYIAAGFRSAVLAGWGAVLLVEWFGNDKGSVSAPTTGTTPAASRA